ncbi:non-ribosomal peptide synthetase [Pseudomonas tolaasii]|nr:non-ribosomal peptide synthase/polyketide synthase [Pseudomonas tolaasii]QXQ16511.1 non-ribosomal peptide synthetase [Pseudomonas tolaasii]
MQQLIESVGALSPEKRKALAILLSQKGINLYGIAPIFRRAAGEPLRLSYAQERQWFLWQLEPDSAAYHIPTALRLRGQLDRSALQRSFDALVVRHETLRTGFVREQEQLLQVVHEPFSLPIAVKAVPADGAGAGLDAWLKAAIEQEISEVFDLMQGPLVRATLLQVAEDDHVLVLVQHHIVSDGASMQVMVEELIEVYAGCCRGEVSVPAALPIQYADYAQWQRSWMDAGERERQLAYWVEQLGGEQPVLELPLDHPRPAVQSYRGARLDVPVPAALGKALQALARREGATLYMLLLASFQTLLHRYSGQRDVRVGVPIANRNRAETERLIGFFVNTQVLHARIDSRSTFRDLLQQVKTVALGAQEHQDLPFEQLVEALAPARSLSRSPLFQVMFNHQTAARSSEQVLQLPGLSVESMAWDTRTAQFDLTMDTHESADGVHASLTYATDLFEPGRIERMAQHWLALLQGIVDAPDRAVGELALLSAAEQQMILQDWNSTSETYPLDASVQQLIETQVLKVPDAQALAFGDVKLTYAELNTRANQLAHQLIAHRVGPDVLVGIAVERSIEMVVGLLAILKAGGAYVPFDPEYPQERLQYMIEDSGIGLLLTQQALVSQLPVPQGLQTLVLDQLDSTGFSSENPNIPVTGENLAYVIYTSGSTGKPKGAGNRHSALTNRLCWMQQAYQLGASDTVLQKTPFSFDVSVWEFFWPLITGARLAVAAPCDHRDPARLVELINREQVSTLHFVPSMLQAFLQDTGVAQCTSLTRIVCSGEALPADAQQQVFAKLPQANLYNLYGPTEAAIDVTHWTCVEEGRDSVPIGRPIANLACYILDDNLEPAPVGVLGELYLGGEGLARGYHRRPSLTAERFAVSPFGHGERLYRTGDLARYRADGVIEYAGRIDHQVKLRGLRIELGEIEARLLEHEAVRETAVTVIDGKHLLAYVVLAETRDNWRETLSAYLQQSLPDYMVPNQWMLLEQLPLSPNGKLDRKALPKPDAAVQQAYVAPRSELEQRIASVWADVLRVEQVGVTDNFFELGGDSIISIQVVGRARQAGIDFTPKELFQYQTVQSLAAVARLGSAGEQIDQRSVTGVTPLLPFQQWFFESAVPDAHHWNQSVLLRPAHNVELAALEASLQALVLHHDALRLRFSEHNGQWQAEHAGDVSQAPLAVAAHVADDVELLALCEQAQRSLNLQQGPLLKGVLATLADGSQRVLLVIHHLVVDGVSWRVLFEDLQTAHTQVSLGLPVTLPAKTSAFKTWAERLQGYAGEAALHGQLPYWQAQLQGAASTLPCHTPDAPLHNRNARTVQTRLSVEATQRLLQQAPAAYRTQVNDLLLTALARVICAWTGQPSTLIQLEGHGREALFDEIDLTRTVGWFTTAFPVRLTPQDDLAGSIKQIKEQLRAIPDKGIGFGVLRYLGDASTQALLRDLPVPRITFNYLGQFDASFDDGQGALFAPATEDRGLEQSPLAPLGNWLTLDGQVYGGQLSIAWTFSEQMFDTPTLQRLADDYAEQLTALIEHCTHSAHVGVTPSDFPLARLSQAQLDQLPVNARSIEDIYPLSPMQQGMLFHSLLEQDAGDYINQMRLRVQGLDAERFCAAWQAALDAHSILRSSFVWEGDLPHALQIVQRDVHLPVELLDWQGHEDLSERLDQLADDERRRGFDLARAPLLRLRLVRTGAGEHELIYTHHHILMDGWSNSQLLGEVLQRYSGQAIEPVGRYRDYIDWLQRQDAGAAQGYWQAQLATLQAPTHLAQSLAGAVQPMDVQGYEQQVHVVGAEQVRHLARFAREQKVTLNTMLQAAWLLVLQRYTGQPTVAFGATVAGRPTELAGALQQIGLFINTLPVIARPDPQLSVADWLQQVQDINLGLREYEHTPLFDIQRWAGQGGEALFDSLLVFENYPVSEALQRGAPDGLSFGAVASREQTNYALTLGCNLGEELELHYSFMCKHFSAAQVRRLHAQLEGLLEQLGRTPQTRLGDLSLLSPQDSAELYASNQPAPARDVRYVHERISAQAERRPQAPAVLFDDHVTSFAELHSQSNRLAQYLVAQGVRPEVRVGVALSRGPQMLVALLAVLKAGGAYVPLDASYPRERLAYLMDDSGIGLLLTDSRLRGQLPLPTGLLALELDNLDLVDWPDSAPRVCVHDESLAYVIYTSGSTGQPKGVCVAHGPLAMHCEAIGQRYAMTEDDCELHFMSFAFDGAHERWLTALTHGSRLAVRDDSLWSPEQTYAAMHRYGVSVVAFPPAYLLQLAEHAELHGNPPPVRIYCFGGDAVPNDSFERVRDALKPEHIINGYGPTETVVTPLIWKADALARCGAAYAPIGSRIGNRSAWVLSADLDVLPHGVAGELFLGGEGLARGYLDRPGMTAERFVPDPFGVPGGRLYRSGDRVRRREDGIFDYQGRVDHQVKIRGFRVELGEVEARLLEQASVRDAAVVAHAGPGGQQLVGYVVPMRQDEALLPWCDALKAELKRSLPDYMVPTHLLALERMPLTPNGKLDRKALPKPDVSTLQQHYVAPVSALEQQVAAIWAEVLRLERVGLSDHFFELGGHSLLATQVISRVRHALGIALPLKALFEHSTLQAFVQCLGPVAGEARETAMAAVDRSQLLALSYAQERQWFLWQLDPQGSAYHIPTALRLRGPLDLSALHYSFDRLIERHESLRTHFTQVDGRVIQVVGAPVSLDIVVEDASGADDAFLRARIDAALAEPFDLRQGPLLRASLLRLSAQEHVLVLAQHHIVSDGWSMQVMVDELVELYAARVQSLPAQLPALPIQYADYAQWQRDWMHAGERERQLAYWLANLGGEPSALELPLDRPRPAVQSHRGARLDIALPAALATSLQALARQQGVTLFMLLLASFQVLLHRYSAQRDIRVGVPVANRHRSETERLIGFFVNTQVLKAELDPQTGFDQLLQQVKQQALAAQEHQDLPFEQLVEALAPDRDLSRSPLFQVLFNHQTAARRDASARQVCGLSFEGVDWDTHTAQFDLALETYESAEQLHASLTYATDLFDAATVERMARHWRALLQGLVEQPRCRIGELPMLADQERQATLAQWNGQPATFAQTAVLHRLIEAQAAQVPDAVALVLGDQQLSYGELNRQANRVAHALIAEGVGPEVLVGIAVERSFDMLVGLLAILKAGGAYVPLDPAYPADRLHYMIEDSGLKLLLTQWPQPTPAGVRNLSIQGDHPAIEHNPQVDVGPDNLAYVIYTSGSTGKPKGTLLPHRNVLRLFDATRGEFNFGPQDCWTLFHSYAFDFSVWEIFGALLHGGRLVIVPQEVSRSPQAFFELLCAEHVTVLNQTPSAFKQLMQVACADEASRTTSLRYVVFGGEALEVNSLRPWFERFGDSTPQLVNMYGITETTVHVTYRPLSLADLNNGASSPLGAAIADLSWYVLDADLNPVPKGCIGELYVGRAGLARGYLNRADLTSTRFVADPFSRDGGRLYRTGDLARYCANGVIEYAGRIDHQVKIRGYRIELGEIEARLQGLPSVREAVVLAAEGPGGTQLVGYLVASAPVDDEAAWRESLRASLKAHLPDYMVPAHLLLLAHMPLTANGKLDRKALPQPDARVLQQAFVAPQSELECKVAAIWADVLKLEQVGMTDHFFELGGHSLLVINIVSRIQLELGMTLVPQLLFQYPVLGDLVVQLQNSGEQVSASKLSLLEDLLDEMEGV